MRFRRPISNLLFVAVATWAIIVIGAFCIVGLVRMAKAQTIDHTMVDESCFNLNWELAVNADNYDVIGTYPDGSESIVTGIQLPPTKVCISERYVPVSYKIIARKGGEENHSDPTFVEWMLWMDADNDGVIGTSDFGKFGAQFGWCKTGEVIITPPPCPNE